MEFRIADTFADSLARLAGDEQRAVKTTAFDLQLNPVNPGMQFHKLDKAKDKNFWSVRINSDIRLIVHKTAGSLLLCYVDHHDAAYHWAERRKLETHPKTGAAQLVELRETVREIAIPKYVDMPQPAKPKRQLFASLSTEQLLSYGVPPDWVDDVHKADEDDLLELAEHLPSEAAEALLQLATGVTPRVTEPITAGSNPFEHPDAQRRFRVFANVEELERALDFPWEKWTVFLHPAQRELVEGQFNGPVRVAGSAGTGKTIVALHRSGFLARTNPATKILVTTFSETLARMLRSRLERLVGNEPEVFGRIAVRDISEVGRELYTDRIGEPRIADEATLRTLLTATAKTEKTLKFSPAFLWTEWSEVVDAWQLNQWEEYRDVARLGRKTRLGEQQRQALWRVFDRVRRSLIEQGLVTDASIFARVSESLKNETARPYDFVIIDEAQDIGVPQLRFLAALGGARKDALFFTGDLGQRIFQLPFSWKSLGVDIRGRSHTLRINYRTSHQIRRQADRLLPPELSDVDGIAEERRGAVSVFNGPAPLIQVFDCEAAEVSAVGKWLAVRTAEVMQPDEIAVCVRSAGQLPRARQAVLAAGLTAIELTANVETQAGHVSVCTMHLAKGLEFKAVAVMACDDDVLPLQERIEAVGDDADLETVFDTERHLLYVACTRARDHLMVTGISPASEFLVDLRI